MDNTKLKYSKLNFIKNNDNNTHKSRSLDFSDLAWFPQTPKSIRKSLNSVVKPRSTATETLNIQIDADDNDAEKTTTTTDIKADHIIVDSDRPMKKDDEQEPDVSDRQKMAVGSKAATPVLRRNSSVSSSSLSSLSSVKARVFSMRRTSSVNSERYCRIYDQSVTLTSSSIHDVAEEDEEEISDDIDTARSTKKQKQKQKGGKILKVCKRFFGL